MQSKINKAKKTAAKGLYKIRPSHKPLPLYNPIALSRKIDTIFNHIIVYPVGLKYSFTVFAGDKKPFIPILTSMPYPTKLKCIQALKIVLTTDFYILNKNGMFIQISNSKYDIQK